MGMGKRMRSLVEMYRDMEAQRNDLRKKLRAAKLELEALQEIGVAQGELNAKLKADRDAWKAAFGVEPLRGPEVAAEYVKALVEEAADRDAFKAALEYQEERAAILATAVGIARLRLQHGEPEKAGAALDDAVRKTHRLLERLLGPREAALLAPKVCSCTMRDSIPIVRELDPACPFHGGGGGEA